MKAEKPPSEAAMMAALASGEVILPPVDVAVLEREPSGRGTAGGVRADAVVAIRWDGREFRFAVECKGTSEPKELAAALDQAERAALGLELSPLVLVPYLPPARLEEIRARGASGIDLCGNGVVQVPGELFVYRTGAPNRFRDERLIKNVYRRNSSLVGRMLLLRPEYEAVGILHAELARRGGILELSTISKALSGLEADLIVERTPGRSWRLRRIRLLQPDKLLDLLEENYRPPNVRREFTGKTSLTEEELRSALEGWRVDAGRRVVGTGAGSVRAYAAMAREERQEFYCSDLPGLLDHLGDAVRQTERFANLRLFETADDFVYFDVRPGLLASPIQAYLELAAGDKRDRETAEQVRRLIMDELPLDRGAEGRDGSAGE
ncbi:hypothetical protein [Tautonia sociabilis]|uniref:Uncharacterized protein n=1 Tax=Tautonia sociabilis TaxID=2080755 RepID=A0A432MD55_9BACT|nr:hypothetical protein [Tautonia sociabilis]RUL81901.1 hypothetical protein TsocGM_24340 [Tautonia sociabilis]